MELFDGHNFSYDRI